eukprot:c19552_g1_i1 orf=2-400(-)
MHASTQLAQFHPPSRFPLAVLSMAGVVVASSQGSSKDLPLKESSFLPGSMSLSRGGGGGSSDNTGGSGNSSNGGHVVRSIAVKALCLLGGALLLRRLTKATTRWDHARNVAQALSGEKFSREQAARDPMTYFN